MNALRVLAVVVGIALLHPAVRAIEPAESIDDVIGVWAGEIEIDGQTAPIGVEFDRHDEKVWATVIVPAFHGRSGLGPAKRVGNRIEVGPLVFDYDPAGPGLTATLPPDFVPRYSPHLTLKRVDAFPLPARAEPAAPVRQPRWTLDLGAPAWSDAVFRAGRIFVGADDGRLHAADAATGRERWTFAAGGAIRAPVAFAGDDIVFPADDGVVYRVRARDGTERWRVRVLEKPVRRVPIADRDSRYQNRAPGVAVSGTRLYVGAGPRVVALDAVAGRRMWEFTAADDIATTPTVSNGMVFVGCFDRHVYALNASTGAVVWKYDTGDAATSDVAVYGRDVIVGSRSYDLESLDGRTGARQWKKYIWFSWVESSPAIYRDAVYVGSSDAAKVFAIDPRTGRSLWEADAFGSAWGRPAVTDEAVFQGAAGVVPYSAPHRGAVLAYDRRSGRLLWWYPIAPPEGATQRTAYGFAASVTTGGGMVFGAALDGRLYAFAQ